MNKELLRHGFFLLFLKSLQLCQFLSPFSIPSYCSHLTLHPRNSFLPISLLQLSFTFLFLCQYKLLALPDALLLIPSLNTPYIRIIGFNGLSWYILNPGIWTWRFQAGSFSPRLIDGSSFRKSSAG